jgi:hypothetical protein
MRIDTNKIAIRAIRNLFDGAKTFEVDVDATKVACRVTSSAPGPWPDGAGGLTEADDGPWPGNVEVDCRWSEGACRLTVVATRWTSGPYPDGSPRFISDRSGCGIEKRDVAGIRSDRDLLSDHDPLQVEALEGVSLSLVAPRTPRPAPPHRAPAGLPP